MEKEERKGIEGREGIALSKDTKNSSRCGYERGESIWKAINLIAFPILSTDVSACTLEVHALASVASKRFRDCTKVVELRFAQECWQARIHLHL